MCKKRNSKRTPVACQLSKAGIDGFLILLITAVGAAYVAPATGSGQGAFSLSSIANCGISVIFFFYGLRLSREKLRVGLGNWRLHILIHLATFIVFPLLILLIRPFFATERNLMLWMGIFYVAALPSTVSSSVVMVSIAKGNIPAAIFNASISSLMGVFITPLWMSLMMAGRTGFDAHELGNVVAKLSLQVLLPVAAGMLLNRRWGTFAEKHKTGLRMFDQSIILLIVYTSFCSSFTHRVFDGFSAVALVCCAAGMVLLFFTVFGIVTFACRRMKMNREDTITAQFCASKKSLVHGTAMSKVIFAGYSGAGLMLLPILLYHALQLMIVSAIAHKKGVEV
ncbi:MAG: bile acid:sodium symporter [Bacteroidales bacterium]|jgi:sodium/bile acid cotransporter 7|nr:bile acid:sodium symporter [Bacteroidales bacterium]